MSEKHKYWVTNVWVAYWQKKQTIYIITTISSKKVKKRFANKAKLYSRITTTIYTYLSKDQLVSVYASAHKSAFAVYRWRFNDNPGLISDLR